MKLKILMKSTGIEKLIECESFDFDSGFLRIINPLPKEQDLTELYFPLAPIEMISNYGVTREKKEKSEKDS